MYGAMAGPAPPRPFQDRTSAAVLTAALHPDDSGAGPPANKRAKPRSVIYKSSALLRAAPRIATAASSSEITSTLAIQRANQAAEIVRDQFKQHKCGPEIDVGDGDDEATNARKYERRLKMNRSSAAASRVRREAYTKSLENELVAMERQYKEALALIEQERQVIRSFVGNEQDENDSGMSSDEDSLDKRPECFQPQVDHSNTFVLQPTAPVPSSNSISQMSLSIPCPDEASHSHSEASKVEDTIPIQLTDMDELSLELPLELPEFFLRPETTDLDKVEFDIPH